jgi:hypothetical protein
VHERRGCEAFRRELKGESKANARPGSTEKPR